MVGIVHGNRTLRERSRHIAMIESLDSESARNMLLDMLAAEIEMRAEAIGRLVRNGSRRGGKANLEDARLRQPRE